VAPRVSLRRDGERAERGEQREAGTGGERGLEPVGDARRRAQVPVGGEHRAGDGDREDGAEPLHHVVDSRCLAKLVRCDGAEHGGGHGRQRHRDAGARDKQGDVQLGPAGRQRAPGGDPGEPGGLQEESRDHHRAAADATAFRSGRSARLVPTRSNGQPAFGLYVRESRGTAAVGNGILVLTLAGSQISAVTGFPGRNALRSFGFPAALPD
jgi:hypothetical protein